MVRAGRMIHWMDEARRQVGRALDVFGLGPQETPHRIVAEWPGARLRAYHDQERADGPVLFIIPAPFKKAYLWDLLPEVSVVRRCLAGGLRVYLLEWLIPTQREDEFGLAEYANRLPAAALDAIRAETGVSAPVLAGHSLGGTLAAIFATLSPERVSGLVPGGRATRLWRARRADCARRRGPCRMRGSSPRRPAPLCRVGDERARPEPLRPTRSRLNAASTSQRACLIGERLPSTPVSRACSWTSSRCPVGCSRRRSSSSTARTALCRVRFRSGSARPGSRACVRR